MTSASAPEIVRMSPGPVATAWLLPQLRGLQVDDPLSPVTVVVPSHHAGLHLRRTLAAQGYAGVRFMVLSELAEALGASRLASEGRAPLTAVTRDALVREGLRAGDRPLAESAGQAGLVDRVSALSVELRRRDDLAVDTGRILGGGTATSRAAIRAIGEYERRRLKAGLYDEVDLLGSAVTALDDGAVDGVLREHGAVVLHLPSRLDAPTAALVRALARRTTVTIALTDVDAEDEAAAARLGVDPPVTSAGEAIPPATASVVIASDPIAEARDAVRGALAALEGDESVPLHRIAIVYRDEETYGTALRDTLRASGVTPAVLGGRPLLDSVAARSLLGLIRLRDQDLARPAVLAWLSGLPHGGGVLRNQARWDQLSRDAGVVRGADQWRHRLTELAEARSRLLAQPDADRDDPTAEARRAAIERDVVDGRRIVEHVAAIDTLTTPPSEPTWQAHVAWALRLRDEFLTPDASWTAEGREASQMVEEVVRGLAAAGAVEPSVSVAVFLRALEDGLRARTRPEGRLGSGVVIGPHRLLLGMDFDRVHVLGAVESSFPAPLPIDPLLAGDPLGRREEHEAAERRDWLVALAAADGGRWSSAPRSPTRTAVPSIPHRGCSSSSPTAGRRRPRPRCATAASPTPGCTGAAATTSSGPKRHRCTSPSAGSGRRPPPTAPNWTWPSSPWRAATTCPWGEP